MPSGNGIGTSHELMFSEPCFGRIFFPFPPNDETFVLGSYSTTDNMPLVTLHWEHRFQRMVKKYNEIYRIQMPNITPHICRHTYCSNQAKAGMNPKTLQYLMGHSEIGVTLDVYTHLGLEDAAEELHSARQEMNRTKNEAI